MRISEFARLVKNAPMLFGVLIERQRVVDSAELRRKICNVYNHVNTNDEREFETANRLHAKRLRRLAVLGGLELSQSALPFAIYEDYVSGKFHSEKKGAEYSNEEIQFWLSAGGEIPMKWWFVIS